MLIEVTEEDISQGRAGSCHFCPVALAVKRAAAHENVVVGRLSITIYAHHIRTPLDVSQFIHDLDKGKDVRPFSFELEVPV